MEVLIAAVVGAALLTIVMIKVTWSVVSRAVDNDSQLSPDQLRMAVVNFQHNAGLNPRDSHVCRGERGSRGALLLLLTRYERLAHGRRRPLAATMRRPGL